MRHQSGCVSVLEHLIETKLTNQMTRKKKKTENERNELSKNQIKSIQNDSIHSKKIIISFEIENKRRKRKKEKKNTNPN